jgi:hypothetical protein
MPREAGRRLARSDDSGATLILALIFITVVAVVIAAILSFVDTSMRTTIAVRDQAARASAADGAAQVAVNYVRTHGYGGSGSCLAGMPALGGLYQQNGVSYSASVACDNTADSLADSGLAYGSGNKPANAILTLDPPGTTAEDGINVTAGGTNIVLFGGDIFSNSTIRAKKNMHTTGAITARGACTGTSITSTPAPVCNYGGAAVGDPGYTAPPTPSATAQTVPACRTNKVVTFTPGLYTDLAGLNTLTGSCTGATFHFPPGVYYFNLNGLWTLNTGFLIGGDATLTDGNNPVIPGVCRSPIPRPMPWTKPPAGDGVEFVFGGTSQLKVSKAQLELCGSYSTNAPPIAVYGLTADLKQGATIVVPAESGCVTTIGGCPVISSDNSPNSNLFIQGTTYVPKALINVALNNNTSQTFGGGVVARSFYFAGTGSPDFSGNVVAGIPDDSLGVGLRTVLYLQVFVCPGTTPCGTGGTPQLKVKVGFRDPSGTPVPGKREVTVYNWSVQRG